MFRIVQVVFAVTFCPFVVKSPAVDSVGFPKMSTNAQQQNRLDRAHEAMGRGQWQAAEALARAGLKANPRDMDFLGVLGASLYQQRRYQDALAPLLRLYEHDPQSGAGGPLGQCYLECGDAAKATQLLEQEVGRSPESPDLRNLLALSLARQSRHSEAIAVLQPARDLNPPLYDTCINLGCLLHETGRHEEAIDNFRRAAELRPERSSAHSNLGKALKSLMRHEEAVASFRLAAVLSPGDPELHDNLGAALADMGRYDEAMASYHMALSIRPDLAKAAYNLGLVFKELKRHGEAIACFEKTLSLEPGHRYALSALAASERAICNWEGFSQRTEQLNRAVTEGSSVIEPFFFLTSSDDPAAQRRCAERSIADLFPANPAPLWNGAIYAHPEIRLAYVSADINAHPVAYLIAGVFERHNRARFKTTCVSLVAGDGSAMRARLERSFDRFVDASRLSDDAVAQVLREGNIDIVVDLSGITARARPAIAARRPAPVRVNFIGFPGTLGGSLADYIIADRFVVPQEYERHYSEKVVCLPDCYMPWDSGQQIDARTPSRADAGLPDEAFVFCSFNNTSKLSPACFDVWMRLLAAIPTSVLWLFQDNQEAASNLRKQARARGVDPQRLIFAQKLPIAQHLARHRLADLFLDSLPYNAHTTASDALWAGLPVLSCAGSAFAGRVAGSMLCAAGMPELAVSTMQEYEALALRLASDRAWLGELRARLASTRHNVPLFDTDRYTQNLEKAFEKMWHLTRLGRAPEAFSVG